MPSLLPGPTGGLAELVDALKKIAEALGLKSAVDVFEAIRLGLVGAVEERHAKAKLYYMIQIEKRRVIDDFSDLLREFGRFRNPQYINCYNFCQRILFIPDKDIQFAAMKFAAEIFEQDYTRAVEWMSTREKALLIQSETTVIPSGLSNRQLTIQPTLPNRQLPVFKAKAYCTNCGYRTKAPTSKFCTNCGNSVIK